MTTNKSIGVHIDECSKYNKGIFLRELIKDFEKNYIKYIKKNKDNEIRMVIKVGDKDINNNIYFLNKGTKNNNLEKI